jgi:hypothetical protein
MTEGACPHACRHPAGGKPNPSGWVRRRLPAARHIAGVCSVLLQSTMRTPYAIFLASVATIAVHVVDDRSSTPSPARRLAIISSAV